MTDQPPQPNKDMADGLLPLPCETGHAYVTPTISTTYPRPPLASTQRDVNGSAYSVRLKRAVVCTLCALCGRIRRCSAGAPGVESGAVGAGLSRGAPSEGTCTAAGGVT